MHLFIDANILLDFYHLTKIDLEELRKLIELINDGKVTLYSNQQLEDEIARNRDAKISDAMDIFQKSGTNLKISFPALCKAFPEYGEMQELLREANKKHAELYRKAMKEIGAKALGADKINLDLLARAHKIDLTEKMIGDAIRRLRLGNPPGKKRVTIGDELNWESLLAGVPNNCDLHLISGDSDYASPFDKSKISSFLSDEWARAKSANLHFYTNIADFFKINFPDIVIASDVQKVASIEGLAASNSFSDTHLMIGRLANSGEFSKQQVENLISILSVNQQVKWIIDDADVREFYTKLLTRYSKRISKEWKEELEAQLAPKPEYQFEPDEFDDDIPF